MNYVYHPSYYARKELTEKRGIKFRKDGYPIVGEGLIGYAIFKRHPTGRLIGMIEQAFSMGWAYNQCAVWPEVPTHMFKPQEGHFLVKTTRTYPDLQVLGYAGNRSNFKFITK